MKPNPKQALEKLEAALNNWTKLNTADFFYEVSQAVGMLRGYKLPAKVLKKYRCSFCGVDGVKLWRAVHSAEEAWCCKCGTLQAGKEDNVDENGMILTRLGCYAETKTDQIYSPNKGLCLLPWIPMPNGQAWGYTSVPPEGVLWWKQLPTRNITETITSKEIVYDKGTKRNIGQITFRLNKVH